MTQREERQVIFNALKEDKKKYNADYYCVILTPSESKKVMLGGSFQRSSDTNGEAGVIIEGIVLKELSKARAKEIREKQ